MPEGGLKLTREMLETKSLADLREIAKLQGVKSITKYRKSELIDIIMAGGKSPKRSQTDYNYEESENELETETVPEPMIEDVIDEGPEEIEGVEGALPEAEQSGSRGQSGGQSFGGGSDPAQKSYRPAYVAPQYRDQKPAAYQQGYRQDNFTRRVYTDNRQQGNYQQRPHYDNRQRDRKRSCRERV
jgi:hypothetical protein